MLYNNGNNEESCENGYRNTNNDMSSFCYVQMAGLY